MDGQDGVDVMFSVAPRGESSRCVGRTRATNDAVNGSSSGVGDDTPLFILSGW